MASITKRANGRWYARFYDPAGVQQGRIFIRKIDAQRWLDEQTKALVSGTYVEPSAGRTTVKEIAEKWLASDPSWTPATRARNESILKRHVLPRWGTTQLERVTFDEVQAWIVGYAQGGLAGGTVRKIAGVLSSVMRFAVLSRKLPATPVVGIRLPKQAVVRKRYLTAQQVEDLADAAGEHSDIVLVLAYCGLRIGELAALRVGGVNLQRRRLQVSESVTEVNGVLRWGSPKDGEERSVPFPRFLVGVLADRTTGRSTEDLVFVSINGGVLRVRNMRRDWFDAAATAVGLKGLTPHELRHTAASLAVSAGANVLAVQRMLGHSKPSVTLDVYSDLFDSDLDDLSTRMDEVRSETRKVRIRYGRSRRGSRNIASMP